MSNTGLLNPYYMPGHKSDAVVDLDTLVGGLNLYEQPYRLGVNETPDIVNLLWRDGALGGRDAQAWLYSVSSGIGYACFDGLYHGYEFYHIGKWLYAMDGVPRKMTATFNTAGDHMVNHDGFVCITGVSDPEATWHDNVVTLPRDMNVTVEYAVTYRYPVCDLSEMYADYKPSRGTFLRYQDHLIYKARGVFVRISTYAGGVFFAKDILSEAYTPITFINAEAASGTGDAYQPENRLSAKKTIWYEAGVEGFVETGAFPSSRNYINVSKDAIGVTDLYVAGKLMTEGIDYKFTTVLGSKTILLTENQQEGDEYEAHLQRPTKTYYLPVKDAQDVEVEARMSADGDILRLTKSTATLTEEPTEWDPSWTDGYYVFWPPTGKILFREAPYVATPRASNTVRITYEKENPTALEAVMSCRYAAVYGGDVNLCLVLGGSSTQPNAIFWNGNNVSMDLTYFPMDAYNLASDSSEAVTGFGRQQNMLVIFKEHSVSKASLDTQTIDDRLHIALNIIDINSRIGCDLPYTIQLIDNNLVFCNTQGGLHILLDTSAANENNIRGISKKINGTPAREGLLKKVKRAGADLCASYDDDSRYWLVVGDEVYVWDYVLSEYRDPSFFYLTGIPAIAFCQAADEVHYVTADGRIAAMGAFTDAESPFYGFAYTDFGQPIPKRYTTPVLFFGDNDRLKDINSVILTVSANTWSRMHITYTTDCETRRDLTEALFAFHRFLPRNLAVRSLAPKTYSTTIRRKPGCRHVRYFSMTIESAEAGMDMSLVSAQIFYRKQGRDR